ncbi:SMC family ATPase [Leptolyngbya sp. 7M]|uniref:SMC family ATPase n=1 Tax=Leptolyngbya sp. 7M TaxID=2812896 RepID=UPI0028F43435|nr:SMC family ATPase [Leptolyngbya sp. 7M]
MDGYSFGLGAVRIEFISKVQIKRLELDNIKSHAASVFEFRPGTTAISGENGVGKTTIVEAIAWALFDVLDYKKDDFVRRGAKKGSVRVTFESGADERDYVVYRDTGTGYYVYDPRLKMRLADKKEEVTRFLWQHLGLEPGTDLETLFKHAIGVPQGTFTAIFLATAAERKRTFDTLLKVEEYRRGAEELLKTQRFIENRISGMNVLIARAEGELERSNALEAERAEVEHSLLSLTKKSEELQAALVLLNDQAADLDRLAEAADAAQKKLAERKAEFEKDSMCSSCREQSRSGQKEP